MSDPDRPAASDPASHPDSDEHAGLPDAGGETAFSAFVMSLATSALMHMGELSDEAGEVQVDLDMARHTIDIIGMLNDKTRGNLSPAESQVIETALYDLRLRFVEARKKATASRPPGQTA